MAPSWALSIAANFGFSVSHFARAVFSSSAHSMYLSRRAASRDSLSRFSWRFRNRASDFRLNRLVLGAKSDLGLAAGGSAVVFGGSAAKSGKLA